MILIVGSDFDDIAFITKAMDVARTDMLISKYEVFVGRYANREVAVAATGYGQEMSALVTGLLIDRYNPYIVISIGSVQSVAPELGKDDLFLATRVYATDVNLMGLGLYKYGQIPEMPDFFLTDSDLRSKIKSFNSLFKNRHLSEGTLLSGNTYFSSSAEFQTIQKDHFIKIANVLATDTETLGVFCAASLFNRPVLVIKGCSNELSVQSQSISRKKTAILLSPVISHLIEALLNTLA